MLSGRTHFFIFAHLLKRAPASIPSPFPSFAHARYNNNGHIKCLDQRAIYTRRKESGMNAGGTRVGQFKVIVC